MIKLHKTIYDEKEVRSQFPIFNSGNLVYLDSAASSQKPFSVIKSINEVYSKHYANMFLKKHFQKTLFQKRFQKIFVNNMFYERV